MPESLHKIALVTGAARGIGLATAKRFLSEGWRVALLDIDAETLDKAVAELAQPEATLALACDVSDPAAVAAAFAALVKRFGRLDALVNNASSFYPTPLDSLTPAQFDDLLVSNLKGPLFLAQACARRR